MSYDCYDLPKWVTTETAFAGITELLAELRAEEPTDKLDKDQRARGKRLEKAKRYAKTIALCKRLEISYDLCNPKRALARHHRNNH